MNAVDTNILIYSNDSREPTKRKIAMDLIANLQDGVLFWQVACKYIAASRKLEKFGFTRAQAFDDLRFLRTSWKPILPTWKVLERAEILMNTNSVSSWDALIIAACIENGVTKLYTEDIGNSFRKFNLEIVNPFQTA